MRHCKIIRILFKLSPFISWRYALLERHLLHCPECLRKAADIEEARSATISKAQIGERMDFWPAFVNRLSHEAKKEEKRFRLSWRWAMGTAGLLALTGVILMTFSPKAESPDLAVKLQVNNPKIYDEPAQAIIFQTQNPNWTFVWVEKQ